jgi:hypothetical protein
MKYIPRILLSDKVWSDDEIDSLFSQLQPIEPPLSLVERILSVVAQLPGPYDLIEDLIVSSDHCEHS